MTITNLNVSYGDKVVFKDFNINFEDKKITAILGPSGCGKTTLLNSLAFDKNYKTSYIFQEPRLLPWYTIEKNLTLVSQHSKKEKKDIVLNYLTKVNLLHKAKDFPKNLSGGERQRVSIARAFCFKAPILLMDEPFQSQDIKLKNQLMQLVKQLNKDEMRTIIAVTHDVQEAIHLADRAVVLGVSKPTQVILDIPIDENNSLNKIITALDS